MAFENGDLRDFIRLQQVQADCKINCKERCERHDRQHEAEGVRLDKMEAHQKVADEFSTGLKSEIEEIKTSLKVDKARSLLIGSIVVAIFAFLGSSAKELFSLFR